VTTAAAWSTLELLSWIAVAAALLGAAGAWLVIGRWSRGRAARERQAGVAHETARGRDEPGSAARN
jgi:hypothetical protein